MIVGSVIRLFCLCCVSVTQIHFRYYVNIPRCDIFLWIVLHLHYNCCFWSLLCIVLVFHCLTCHTVHPLLYLPGCYIHCNFPLFQDLYIPAALLQLVLLCISGYSLLSGYAIHFGIFILCIFIICLDILFLISECYSPCLFRCCCLSAFSVYYVVWHGQFLPLSS